MITRHKGRVYLPAQIHEITDDYVTDYFDRTVAAGIALGTANVGGAYTAFQTVTGTRVSVSTGAGRIAATASPQTFFQMLQGATIPDDSKQTLLCSLNQLPTGTNGVEISVLFRAETTTSPDDNHYRARLEILPNASGILWVDRVIAASTFSLNAVGVTAFSAGTMVAGQKYWLEATLEGFDFNVRAWKDGDAPPAYQLNVNDPLSQWPSGDVGLRYRIQTSVTAIPEAQFWNYRVLPIGVITGPIVLTDTGTGNLVLTASATETKESVDSATTTMAITASGVEYRSVEVSDAATATMSMTASATENAQFTETATSALTYTSTGAEFRTLVEAATSLLTYTPTATEIAGRVDAATATMSMTASALETQQFVETATVNFVFTPTATEFMSTHAVDAATANFSFTSTGTDIAQYADSTTTALNLTATAVEVPAHLDAATATLTFTSTATEIAERVDADTATVLWTATSTEFRTLVEAATVNFVFTPSGVEFKGGETLDAATANFVFTITATEAAQFVEITTSLLTYTSTSTEFRTILDAATANFIFTSSGVDIPGGVEAATAPLIWTASATDFRTLVEVQTSNLVYTSTGIEFLGNELADSFTVPLAYTVVQTGTLFSDLFLRTVAGGLGTDIYGRELYGYTPGAAQALWSVNGSRAVLDAATTSNYFIWPLDLYLAQPATMLTRLSVSALPQAASFNHMGHQHMYPGTNDGYLVRFTVTETGAYRIVLLRVNSGTSTQLLTDNLGTYTPGDEYWLRSMVVNYRIYGKLWKDGTTEPADWTHSAYDTTQAFNTPNHPALWFRSTNSSSFPDFTLDDFSVGAVDNALIAVDADTAQVALTATGVEAQPGVDAATASLSMTASGTEQRAGVEAATSALTMTATGVDIRGRVDVATVNLAYTTTGVEQRTGVDVATTNLAYTSSGTDIHGVGNVDVATVPLAYTTTAVEDYFLDDQATANLTFIGFAPLEFADDYQVSVTYTPFSFEIPPDQGVTVPMFYQASGVEIVTLTTPGLAELLYFVIDQQEYASLDTAIALLVFQPTTITELYRIADYLLEVTNMDHRWDATLRHRDPVVMLPKKMTVTGMDRRWHVVFKGRGLLAEVQQ